MRALIGRKLGMSQIFGDSGAIIPVTMVQAGPCTVTLVRSKDKDGYSAVQLGYGAAKRLSKPLQGHFKQSGASPQIAREFALGSELPEPAEAEVETNADQPVPKIGDTFDVSMFSVGESVSVSGTSKGKGFAGTIKRHNFHRGPKTHGSRNYRAPGSIGSMYPQKIWKGKKMAGQMGNETHTLRSVTVADIDTEANLLALKGAIPGGRGNYVIITGAPVAAEAVAAAESAKE